MARIRCSRNLALAIFGLLVAGCSGDPTDPVPGDETTKPNVEQPSKDNTTEPIEEEPDPADVWAELLEKAKDQIQQDQLDEAKQTIAELNNVAAELAELPESSVDDPTADIAGLQQQIDQRAAILANAFRQERIVAAEQFMNRAKFVEATQALNDVLARQPTDDQRERVGTLAAEIERMRRARRDLQSWMQLLESTDRREIVTAQTYLSQNIETALSMLVEATEQTEKPVLVRNSLELLRLFKRSEVSVPAMLAVLRRPEQQENWADAVRELGKFTVPGAGKPLLELALSAKEPNQRAAALSALAQVVDPPQHTLAALLPLVNEDSKELAAIFWAAHHAVIVHRQQDLVARRGLDTPLSDEQRKLFAALPERLQKAMSSDSKEVAAAAKVLACSVGQIEPQPVKGVKVARAHAEAEDGPATAVVDGIWNSVDLKTMWRHPVNKQSLIELDLGETRTVTGVRIWNFNEASYGSRGWKDVHIYVGDNPARMRLVAKGIVPQAPGADNPPDYSTLVPIAYAQGRYVRLVGKTTWSPNAHTGLAEVQVLGL